MADLTPEQLQAQLDAVNAQLAAAQKAAEAAKAEAAEAKAKLGASNAPVKINGTYKGYSFVDGHRRIRDRKGALCDTQEVLNAANNAADPNHATAVAILDWYISTGYGYLVKKGDTPKKEKA